MKPGARLQGRAALASSAHPARMPGTARGPPATKGCPLVRLGKLAGLSARSARMSLHKHRSRIVTDGLTRAPNVPSCVPPAARRTGPRQVVRRHRDHSAARTRRARCRSRPQADQARLGVAGGGGVPVCFTTISMSDGTSMNHAGMRMSLLSRELIADSVEMVVRGMATMRSSASRAATRRFPV